MVEQDGVGQLAEPVHNGLVLGSELRELLLDQALLLQRSAARARVGRPVQKPLSEVRRAADVGSGQQSLLGHRVVLKMFYHTLDNDAFVGRRELLELSVRGLGRDHAVLGSVLSFQPGIQPAETDSALEKLSEP